MFCMSNWALVTAVVDPWFRGRPAAHPAIPLVSAVLIGLSALMAIETVVAIAGRRSGGTAIPDGEPAGA
jgi:hypothetical protein